MTLRSLPGLIALCGSVLAWGGCGTPTEIKSVPPAPMAAQLGGVQTDHHAVVEIVSLPGDAMVVVNRQPIGVTPQRLELPTTPQGFLAEPVAITVRFVARDVTEASITQSTILHNTDRAPQRLEFDREKVRRVFAD